MTFVGSYNFTVDAGETWQPVFRWGSDVLISKPITGITLAAPPAITATAHGVPDGWLVALTGVAGMVQINTSNYPPRGSDWRQATLIDANTVSLNKVDATVFSAYTNGGFLIYNTPVDLSTVSAAVLTIFDNPGHTGTPLVTLNLAAGIVLNNVTKTITATLQTAGLTWTTGYYELVLTVGTTVTELINGVLTIAP